jgi:Ca2+/Na+ antiporter
LPETATSSGRSAASDEAGSARSGAAYWPAVGWVGPNSLILVGLYFVAMRRVFTHERGQPVSGKRSSAACSSPSPRRCLEIVVSIAAVRMGALDLGIGNVLGSNLFNLLTLGPVTWSPCWPLCS